MSKGLKIVLLTLVALLIVIAAGVGILWFSPILGGSLPDTRVNFNPQSLETRANQTRPATSQAQSSTNDLMHSTDLPGETPRQSVTDVLDSSSTPSPNLAPSTTSESQIPPSPVCNGPEAMTMLVVVLDERIQADAIRVVRVDFVSSTVSILSIPRDFYVPIIDMRAHGITEGRINATYGYGETLLGKGKGIISLTDNLTYNFGVFFDNYLVLNLDDIASTIDRVGGVDIHLDRPVSDGWSNFRSGDHHFDGETAVIFMRMRLFDDDFARVQRQTMVLKGFYDKAMSDLNLIEQTQMVFKVLADKTIQTDMSLKNITPLICLARSIDSNNVTFYEVEKSMYRSHTTSAGANVLIPNDSVVPYIQSILDGSYNPQ
jgi:LCP family protein required for cell wall assembly